MGIIPSPEEMQMMDTVRRLRQLGFPTDMDKLIAHANDGAIKLLPMNKRVPDERKDTEVKETPFPGEFTPLRIPG